MDGERERECEEREREEGEEREAFKRHLRCCMFLTQGNIIEKNMIKYTGIKRNTFTFSHLADALIQSDLQ